MSSPCLQQLRSSISMGGPSISTALLILAAPQQLHRLLSFLSSSLFISWFQLHPRL